MVLAVINGRSQKSKPCIGKALIKKFSRHAELVSASPLFNEVLKQVQDDVVL